MMLVGEWVGGGLGGSFVAHLYAAPTLVLAEAGVKTGDLRDDIHDCFVFALKTILSHWWFYGWSFPQELQVPDVGVSSLKALGHCQKADGLPCRTGCVQSDPNGSTSEIAAQFSSLYWK
jgi:hypothetical protein